MNAVWIMMLIVAAAFLGIGWYCTGNAARRKP